jgi:hypothetical protein
MRAAVLLLLIVSCTPTIDRVERHDGSVTDSALSVLSSLEKDTVTLVQVKTVERVRLIEAQPIREALGMQVYPLDRGGCDTVWVRDTVYIRQ